VRRLALFSSVWPTDTPITGTRTPNVLLRKRIALADKHGMQLYDEFGRPATWNKRTHRIDEARVPAYIVPPGLADTPVSAKREQRKGNAWRPM